MKKSPLALSAFFLAITVYRTAMFAADGLALDWLGTAFAIGIAVGVYVSAYFIRRKETALWAWLALPAFMIVDLAFNMLEVVRTLSTANFVPNDANFLEMNSADIRFAMQWAGIAFGMFPTLATALLGLMQGGADRIDWTNRASIFWQIRMAIMAKFGIGNVAEPAIDNGITVTKPAIPQIINGKRGGTPKTQLTADQVSELPRLEDGQIVAMYGIAPRTARKWKQDVKSGTW
jgi:hypothetical protein